MPSYNISINPDLAQVVEREMKRKKFSNKSEFFRDLIRRAYVGNEDMVIEPILPDDADYKILEDRKKTEKTFVPLSSLL